MKKCIYTSRKEILGFIAENNTRKVHISMYNSTLYKVDVVNSVQQIEQLGALSLKEAVLIKDELMNNKKETLIKLSDTPFHLSVLDATSENEGGFSLSIVRDDVFQDSVARHEKHRNRLELSLGSSQMGLTSV